MMMKILSARFGQAEMENNNPVDPSIRGILIETDEIGSVATSEHDSPHSGGAWEALQAWLSAGNTIADYVPPVKE